MAYRELLIGCGHSREKRINPARPGGQLHPGDTWHELETLDMVAAADPDWLVDLDSVPWGQSDGAGKWTPVPSDTYTEVHAYEVLEHLGRQGRVTDFFATFLEIWRVLAPGGWLCATTPSRYSGWLWGDPGHTRAILPESLVFLDRSQAAQMGQTAMSDYRHLWLGDFRIDVTNDNRSAHTFILQAVKPARPWP